MKLELSGPRRWIFIAVIGCSLVYLAYLFIEYIYTDEVQYENSRTPGVDITEDCTLGPTLCGHIEECGSLAPFDNGSVSEFIDGSIPDFYTWRYSNNGRELEQLFYEALCLFSLQTGRDVSSQELTAVARIYVVHEIEFMRGIANVWWLWIVSIVCAIALFLSSRDRQFDSEGDIDESRRRDPLYIVKKSFDYRGRFDVVQWFIVILLWTGVNVLLNFLPFTQSNIYNAIVLVVFFASIISTLIATVRRFHDYRKSSSRIGKPKHWISLAWIYLVANICLFILSLCGLSLLGLSSGELFNEYGGVWATLSATYLIFTLIFGCSALVALWIARPQTLRLNKVILRTIAWLLTVVLGALVAVTTLGGLMNLIEPGSGALDYWEIFSIDLYSLIGLALSQRAIRQSKVKSIEMDSDAGDVIDSSSLDNFDD